MRPLKTSSGVNRGVRGHKYDISYLYTPARTFSLRKKMDSAIQTLFCHRQPETESLEAFGFTPRPQGGYVYTCAVDGSSLVIEVLVLPPGTVEARVLDTRMDNEPYTLHTAPFCTGFAARVGRQYRRVLQDIAERCFKKSVFKNPQTRQIIDYLARTYGTEPEYLWERFPRNAVFRRRDNARWYALLVALEGKKIAGRKNDETLAEIAVIRTTEEQLSDCLTKKGYYPAYHMNKKRWITLLLDGSVPTENILPHLDVSYELAARK